MKIPLKIHHTKFKGFKFCFWFEQNARSSWNIGIPLKILQNPIYP